MLPEVKVRWRSHRYQWARWVVATVALSLTWIQASGATSEKDKQREILSGQFAQDLQELTNTLSKTTFHITQAFAESLESLEKRAAQAGHYELALRWQSERRQLLESVAQVDPHRRAQDRERGVSLLPREASLSGVALVDNQGLERWRQKGSATWDLRGTRPGSYQVWARYACSPKTEDSTDDSGKQVKLRNGGKVSLSEQSNLIGTGAQTLTHRVLPSTDALSPRDVLLGEIELKHTAPTLKLEALEVEDLGLFTLYGLRLRPSFTEPLVKAATPSMTEIRRSFQSALLKRLRPLREHHLARLEQFKLRATSENDADLVRQIEESMDKLREGFSDRP